MITSICNIFMMMDVEKWTKTIHIDLNWKGFWCQMIATVVNIFMMIKGKELVITHGIDLNVITLLLLFA